jgi:hypothetical protein
VADETPVDEWIFRAMIEDKGRPRLGGTALTLGIRPGHDIELDANATVQRPTFQPGAKNGLSCAPSVAMLPPFALPVRFGGRNKKTEVWKIQTPSLGPELEAHRDGSRHISVGPSKTMPLADYVSAIEKTATHWVKVK